jgi:hypothetical protein
MASCGGLAIRLVLYRKIVRADYQSAAGYQPAPHANQVRNELTRSLQPALFGFSQLLRLSDPFR